MIGEWVDYNEHPVGVNIKGLTGKVAGTLSARGSEELDRIYLYNDGCVPTHDKKSMDAYLARLGKLMALKIAS